MGHYPIKCIHCMRSVRMYKRLVKLDPNVLQCANDEYQQNESMNLNNALDLELNNIGVSADGAIEYKSIEQLEEEGCIKESVLFDVPISKEFEVIRECKERKLIRALELENIKIGNKVYHGVVNRFYCPYCKREMIPQSGQMPIYLICLMGPSSAGKTVYITILHMLLGGKTYPLPEGYVHFETVGSTAKEYQTYVNELRMRGKMPATTVMDRKDAYLLKASYVMNEKSGIENKECLIGLVDMRGEMFNGEHDNDLEKTNLPQFKEADGFLMMVDPVTLEGVFYNLPYNILGNRKIEELNQTINNMKLTIGNTVTPAFEGGKITSPCVVALTKTDLLQKYYNQLRIPLQQPVIAPNFKHVVGTDWSMEYYAKLSQSTKACIQYLSEGFAHFLDNTFYQPYYVSISALGMYVNIEGDLIDNPNALAPLRVEDPLLQFLMDFKIIPPFYQHEYFMDPYQTLNDWGERYAEKWVHLENPASNNRRVRRRLFFK